MHELGVVFHIADSLAKIAEENHVARISRVTLQLGEVSTSRRSPEESLSP